MTINEALVTVLRSPEGRHTMWWITRVMCGVTQSTFSPGVQSAYAEGRRSIGVDLEMRMRDAAREGWAQTILENEVDPLRNDVQREEDETDG